VNCNINAILEKAKSEIGTKRKNTKCIKEETDEEKRFTSDL
jgi:hypothetical protein